jgi:hypothetical protein
VVPPVGSLGPFLAPLPRLRLPAEFQTRHGSMQALSDVVGTRPSGADSCGCSLTGLVLANRVSSMLACDSGGSYGFDLGGVVYTT